MRNFIKVLAHGCFKSKIYNNNKNKNNKNKNSLEFIYDDFKTQILKIIIFNKCKYLMIVMLKRGYLF